jgi:thiol-disulfide isomerase/thioredoxin
MRKMFAVLALAAVASVAFADDEKKSDKLAAGDAAPALKATKWLQGDEVKGFKKDHVYVVEFWATWCGPCIAMMPHVSELQQQYKKDVTFIGFSSKDDYGNNEAKVTAFVKKRGPKLKYTFAFEDNRDTNDAWMKAAGRGGIPCCFVVDKASKIAWVGHPMYLDVVLPKVVKGKWDKKGAEEINGIEEEVNDLFEATRGKDAQESLDKFEAFDKKHPELSKIPYFTGPKINLMLQAKKTADARKFAEKILDGAIKSDDTSAMQTVSAVLRLPNARTNKDLMALSLKAAEAMVTVAGDKDMMAMYNMAETQFAAGNKAKAVEYGQKAVEAADSPRNKKALEARLKAYDDTKKGEKDEKKKKDD